jgi:hypothetical protein
MDMHEKYKPMPSASLLSVIRSRSAILIGLVVSLAAFAFQYHLMATLPGAMNQQCVIGAGLNATNMAFAILISVLAGLVVGGLWLVARNRFMASGIQALSLSGIGMVFGILTGFCTLCALPALSLFGISLSLGFVTDHAIIVRLVSTALLLLALYRVNSQIRGQCTRCVA